MKAGKQAIPASHPVRELVTQAQREAAGDVVTCGECGRSWDDAVVTGWTPAPGGRCPFEGWHAEPTRYLCLTHNGDPYGRGFVASECAHPSERFHVYRGDIGARSRAWWRRYARAHGYKLAEAR